MLRLPIRRKWFDMIESGQKNEEYREIKGYWARRFFLAGLLNGDGTPSGKSVEALLINGYHKNAAAMACKVRLSIGPGKNAWGAVPGKDYYRLEILARKRVR